MSSEWAMFAGTIAGGFVSVGTTWFSHWLTAQKQDRLGALRKQHLKKALAGAEKNGWMEIKTLAQIVGADLEGTRALLIEIEARGSMRTNREVWSLISRNPLPST